MIKRQLLVMMLVAGIAAAGAMGQAQPKDSEQENQGMNMDQPKAESILKHIPADCMGFVVAENLKDAVANIEKFAREIGLGEMLDQMAPGGILPMVGDRAGIGDGFNPNGGVALMMLDFEKAGLDIGAMFTGKGPGGPPPVVILLAGKSAESAFPGMPLSEDGKMITIPNMGPMFFAQKGQYIAFSPNEKALGLMDSPSVENSTSKAQKDLLLKSDVALFYNMKVLASLMDKMTKAMEENQEDGPMLAIPGLPTGILKFYASFMEQCDGMTIGLRIGDTGILAESVVEYVPGSDLAKLLTSYGTADNKNLINRLPNLTYALAGGGVCSQGQDKTMIDMNIMGLETLLSMADLELPADLKERLINFSLKMTGQIQKVQYVLGGPKDAGLFGLGMVIECKNAEKTKALLPEEAELLTELIQKTIGMKEEDLQSLQFKYVKGVATVAGVTVDAIEVQHEELTTMEENDKAEMVKVLSEDKIRFLVAQVDPKTLVLTFGGGESFLGEAIKAAQKGGPIQTDPGVAAAMKFMPPNPVAVVVFSPANIFDLIQKGMKVMGEESDLPEGFAFESKNPVAMASAVKGSTVTSVFYLPTSVVKDVYKLIMAEIAGPGVVEDEEVIEVEAEEVPAEAKPAEKKAE